MWRSRSIIEPIEPWFVSECRLCSKLEQLGLLESSILGVPWFQEVVVGGFLFGALQPSLITRYSHYSKNPNIHSNKEVAIILLRQEKT